jgi:nucleoside-diphosphate kinase
MRFLFFLAAMMAFFYALPALSPSSEANEQTLSIIKPDAVASNNIGDIITRFEKNGLRISGMKMVQLTRTQAESFYAVLKDRPFYQELTEYMSSGPLVLLVLQGKNAVAKNRELMGATDPKKAAPGTIRADFAKSFTQNAVHGSDSKENAELEIGFFFQPDEIFSR